MMRRIIGLLTVVGLMGLSFQQFPDRKQDEDSGKRVLVHDLDFWVSSTGSAIALYRGDCDVMKEFERGVAAWTGNENKAWLKDGKRVGYDGRKKVFMGKKL